MKKILVIMSLVLAAGISFAEEFAGPFSSTYSAFTTATTKSSMVSGVKGKIEYKSTIINTTKDKGKISEKHTAIHNSNSTSADASINTNEIETMNLIKVSDNYSSIAESKTQLSGTLFNFVDAKLTLLSNKQFDASTFALSKTWTNTYIEWISFVNFDQATLYSALTRYNELKIRNRIGITEGQMKAVLSNGRFFVDRTSDETYIRMMLKNMNLYFRPYDLNWSFGNRYLVYRDDTMAERVMYKETLKSEELLYKGKTLDEDESAFYNNNFDYEYLNTWDPALDIVLTADLFESKGIVTQRPGMEAIYDMGAVKIYGALSTDVRTIEKEDLKIYNGTPDIISTRTEIETISNENALKFGVNASLNNTTKLYTALYVMMGSEETEIKQNIEGTLGNRNREITENSKENENYIGLNFDGETGMALSPTMNLKFRGEFDFRNAGTNIENQETKETYTVSGSTAAAVTLPLTGGATEESNMNKIGLYLKATLEIKNVIDPYVAFKMVRNGYTIKADNNIRIEDGNIKTEDEYTINTMEISLGAKKKIDAVTLDAEMKFIGAPANETTSERTYEDTTDKRINKTVIEAEGRSSFGIGLKATYEF